MSTHRATMSTCDAMPPNTLRPAAGKPTAIIIIIILIIIILLLFKYNGGEGVYATVYCRTSFSLNYDLLIERLARQWVAYSERHNPKSRRFSRPSVAALPFAAARSSASLPSSPNIPPCVHRSPIL
jgi:hypothetical protein